MDRALFKEHQIKGVADLEHKIDMLGGGYLWGGMRTGKTRVAIQALANKGCKYMLFLTKKNNIGNVEKDYELLNKDSKFVIEVKTLDYFRQRFVAEFSNMLIPYDGLIIDEAHNGIAKYPQNTLSFTCLRKYIRKENPKVVLLSATPCAESNSQWYKQIALIPGNRLTQRYPKFLLFAQDNVQIRTIRMGGSLSFTNYDKCVLTAESMEMVKECVVEMHSSENPVNEYREYKVLIKCDYTESYLKQLRRGYSIPEYGLFCENNSRLLALLRMISGGTYNEKIPEEKQQIYHHFPCVKQEFLQQQIDAGKRIVIYYYYKSEGAMLNEVFGQYLAESVDEFNEGQKQAAALQVTSYREGIKLMNFDEMIFYTTDYSTLSYIQAKERGISYFLRGQQNYKIKFLINESEFSIDNIVFDHVIRKNKTFKSNTLTLMKKQPVC